MTMAYNGSYCYSYALNLSDLYLVDGGR